MVDWRVWGSGLGDAFQQHAARQHQIGIQEMQHEQALNRIRAQMQARLDQEREMNDILGSRWRMKGDIIQENYAGMTPPEGEQKKRKKEKKKKKENGRTSSSKSSSGGAAGISAGTPEGNNNKSGNKNKSGKNNGLSNKKKVY